MLRAFGNLADLTGIHLTPFIIRLEQYPCRAESIDIKGQEARVEGARAIQERVLLVIYGG